MIFQKKTILLFLIIFYHHNLFSQNNNCGAYQAMQGFDIFSPSENSLENANQRNTYTIPTVFHILYNNENDILSFQEVQASIDFINQRLRGEFLPNDPNIAPTFLSLASGTDIQLALAGKNPEGNCTNGITKTQTDTTKFFNLNNPKFESTGGKDGWNARQYLNIWVVPDYVVLGSASFPNNLVVEDGFDGLVIRKSLVMDGVFIHELGHWFNLPHIWGNNNNCCLPENCSIDDGFQDTPNTIGHLNTPSTNQTCSSEDNVQNYMELTTERLMFTPEQVAAMQATLNSSLGYRNELSTEENHRTTGIIENEDCDFLITYFSEKWEYNIHPNPFFNELNIEIRSFENREIKIRLYDTSGRLVINYTSPMIGKIIIPSNNLNTGVYFLEIDNGDSKEVRKVVKL